MPPNGKGGCFFFAFFSASRRKTDEDCVTEKCPYPKGWEIWPKKKKARRDVRITGGCWMFQMGDFSTGVFFGGFTVVYDRHVFVFLMFFMVSEKSSPGINLSKSFEFICFAGVVVAVVDPQMGGSWVAEGQSLNDVTMFNDMVYIYDIVWSREGDQGTVTRVRPTVVVWTSAAKDHGRRCFLASRKIYSTIDW